MNAIFLVVLRKKSDDEIRFNKNFLEGIIR